MAVVPRELLVTYGSLVVTGIGNGTGIYTISTSPMPDWVLVGAQIVVFGAANAANNGVFNVTSVGAATITTDNSSSVTEGAGAFIGIPVAGASNYHMHEKSKFQSAYKTRSYEFEAIIQSTSEAIFQQRALSLERAFRVPRQRFRVLLNNTVMEDLNPTAGASGNTGFNQEASIEKVGDMWDTGRSRHYRIRVEAQRPSDLAGQSGRSVEGSVDVTFSASKQRIITLSGRYTALGSNNSRTQYQANIDVYATAVQTSIANGDGSVYELISEVAVADDADKNLDFTRKYEEIIYNQSSGARDNASIIMGRYQYQRQQVAPGDSDPLARRLEPLEVQFECWVDKTITTDLNGLWNGTIRPYISSEVKRIMSASAAALVDTQVSVDQSLNRISGRLMYQALAQGGGGLIQVRNTTKIQTNTGKILVPVWDGNIWAKHVYDGPADMIRTRTTVKLILGTAGSSSGPASGSSNSAAVGASFGGGIVAGQGSIQIGFANGFVQGVFGSNSGAAQSALVQAALSDGPPPGGEDPGLAAGGINGFVTMTDIVTITPIFLGLPGDQLTLSEVTREIIDVYVEAPGGGGGGGANGDPVRDPVATR